MRRVITLVFISCIALVAGPSTANDFGSVNFDQGPDASAILRQARERVGNPKLIKLHVLEDIPPLPPGFESVEIPVAVPKWKIFSLPQNPTLPCESPNQPEDDGKSSAAAFSCQEEKGEKAILEGASVNDVLPDDPQNSKLGLLRTGPYAPLVEDSAAYAEALELKRKLEGDVKGIDPIAARRVLADFPPLQITRNSLLSDARPLDVEDEQVDVERARLGVWANRINSRSAMLKDYLAQHERECRTGSPPPTDARTCNRWAERFNTCVDRQNASRTRFRGAVAAWESRDKELRAKGTALRKKVGDWEGLQILPWSNRAKRVLEGGCNKLIGMGIMPASKRLAAGGVAQPFDALPKFEAEDNPCKVSYLWQASGGVGILTVSPTDQEHATLVTGQNPAQGSVTVDGVDTSGARASATATVIVAHACGLITEERLPPQPPDNLLCTKCVYKCTDGSATTDLLCTTSSYPICPPVAPMP